MNRFLTCTALGLLMTVTPAVAQTSTTPSEPANPSATQAPATPGGAMDSPSTQPNSPSMNQSDSMPREIMPDTAATDDANGNSVSNRADADKMDSKMDSASNVQFLNEQNDSDWLATDLIGKNVVNNDNESIGDVNNLVTDRDGKIVAILIGAGGFLGIGEKDVAVRFEDIKLVREDDDVKLMLDTNKDTLASAPDFRKLDEQPVVQGEADAPAKDADRPSAN